MFLFVAFYVVQSHNVNSDIPCDSIHTSFKFLASMTLRALPLLKSKLYPPDLTLCVNLRDSANKASLFQLCLLILRKNGVIKVVKVRDPCECDHAGEIPVKLERFPRFPTLFGPDRERNKMAGDEGAHRVMQWLNVTVVSLMLSMLDRGPGAPTPPSVL